MYLIHNTNISALKSILKDGYLKSYSLLKKKPTDNEGEGLYTENNFVYFSCTDKLPDNKIHSSITMYFNSKLLFNKTFYVSTMHSYEPDKLGEWHDIDDNGQKKKMYKRKYNRYYTKYNTVLKKLYDFSISLLNGKAFQVFQQVAVRNKVNLDELVAIEFNDKSLITDSIKNYINKYYPNVIILNIP
jgi:hypothetical protein